MDSSALMGQCAPYKDCLESEEYGVRTDDPEPLHFLQQRNIEILQFQVLRK